MFFNYFAVSFIQPEIFQFAKLVQINWRVSFFFELISGGARSFFHLRYIGAQTIFNLDFCFPPAPAYDKYCVFPNPNKM